ncbi:hypothetical protein AAFF_G00179240 [Aldrovandia affinis]|uniref:DM14 domain-containing protein n=1 Tax=Aldrovandia affinis TaxID=143900 RepID=A0AAD7W758_9TELE|nr:hypothetical protein AAFF_G00179240 [Aldrovandia affinis]
MLDALPVYPNFLSFLVSERGEQSFTGVLEAALKLATQDVDEEEEEEQGEEVPKPAVKLASNQAKAPAPPSPSLRAPGTPWPPVKASNWDPKQLNFILARRQQFVWAALCSKQMNDMQGAALHLCHAKGLYHMITTAKGGLPVDITKIIKIARGSRGKLLDVIPHCLSVCVIRRLLA